MSVAGLWMSVWSSHDTLWDKAWTGPDTHPHSTQQSPSVKVVLKRRRMEFIHLLMPYTPSDFVRFTRIVKLKCSQFCCLSSQCAVYFEMCRQLCTSPSQAITENTFIRRLSLEPISVFLVEWVMFGKLNKLSGTEQLDVHYTECRWVLSSHESYNNMDWSNTHPHTLLRHSSLNSINIFRSLHMSTTNNM